MSPSRPPARHLTDDRRNRDPAIRLRVLGSVELISSGGTSLDAVLAQPKRTALLCYLAVTPPVGFQRRDVIKALFWPDYDAEEARHALRQALYFLRHAAGPGVIVSRGDELAVSPDHLACDAWDFERAAREGQHEDALALYRGDLLPGFHLTDAPEFERWLDGERDRLRGLAAATAWAAAEARVDAGDPGGAAQWARRAAAFVGGDETGLRRLLLFLVRLGDRAAALRAYERFVAELARDYDLEPSLETRLLAGRIRDGGQSVRVDADEPAGDGRDAATFRAERAEQASEARRPPEAPDAVASSGPAPVPVRRSRMPMRPAVLVALLSMVAATGFWWIASPPPGERGGERILVADFVGPADDSMLGDLVTQLLRSELARSPALSVAGPPAVDEALRRMRLPADSRLTHALARDLAIREEIKVVVAGRVDAVGSGVALSASVIEATSGETLYGATDAAYDRGDSRSVLQAISRLAKSLRRGAGESVAIASTGDSLWSFTTPSTYALAGHMAGTRAFFRGDYLTAANLFEDVLAIDPEFAHAHLMLAGMRKRALLPLGPGLRALERAYELRPGLTPRERYAVDGNYHLNVTGEVDEAVAAFRRHLEARAPGEGAWYQSYAASLIAAGDLTRAREILDESLEVYSTADSRTLHAAVLVALGEEHEARRRLTGWLDADPRHPALRRASARLLAAGGAWTEAHTEAERIRRDTGLDNGLLTMALIDAVLGRRDEARSHLLALRDQAVALGALPAALEITCALDRLRLDAGDAPPLAETEDLLRRHPIASIDTLSRPYLPLALCFARAGRPERAHAWLDAYQREFPARLRGPDGRLLHRARAVLALAEGRPEEAVRALRDAARSAPLRAGLFDDPYLSVADDPELARAYDRLGVADSAIAVYERYLAARSLDRTVVDAFELAPALARLAQLREARGDDQRAAADLRRFARLWRDADAALLPRVREAERRAAELARSPS